MIATIIPDVRNHYPVLLNEIIVEPAINNLTSEMSNKQTTANQEVESIIANNHSNDYEQSYSEEVLNTSDEAEVSNSVDAEHVSNGLENFGVEGETSPDLFSSDDETKENESLLSNETTENTSEDDDLEIPAFLRRQKN